MRYKDCRIILLYIILIITCTGTVMAEPLNLDQLIEMVEQNPEIQEAKSIYEASKTRVPQKQALPDPMLEVGYSNRMDDGPMVGAQQMIPYPGKLSLMGKMTESEVETLRQNWEMMRLKVIGETKVEYYKLYYLNKAVQILEKKKQYLELMEKTISSRYSTGLASQTDILKIQIEISMIEEELTMLRSKIETGISFINRCCLGMPQGVNIEIEYPDDLEIPLGSYDFLKLEELAIENSPLLKMRNSEIQMQEYGYRLARKELNPDFVVSVEFMNPHKEFIKEFTAKLGFIIPLYKNKKQKNAIRESELLLESKKHKYESTKQIEVLFMLKKYYEMMESAAKIARLYKTTILAQAGLSYESAMANYQVGKIDLLMWLDTVNDLLDSELKYTEEVAEFYKAKSEIEPIIGKSLDTMDITSKSLETSG